jgi:hypothetical protein
MTDTPTLTAEAIETLAQQVEKMTPGTWEVCCDDDPQRIHRAPHLRVATGRGTFYEPGKSGADVRGLVALRNAAPALIAAARTNLARERALGTFLRRIDVWLNTSSDVAGGDIDAATAIFDDLLPLLARATSETE